MAVTVNQLYKSSRQSYGLKPVAGFEGFNNIVEWVHIIETTNVSAFLRGQELVFTTGVMNNTGRWMLEFVKQLYKANASALVVNVGPYIPSISDEVIAYCNEVHFPLFSLPWKTRMVDMTRDFCALISQSLNDDTDASNTFKNIALHKGNKENNLVNMAAVGYRMENCAYIACIGSKNGIDSIDEKVKIYGEQSGKSIENLYCSFEYNGCIIALLYKYSLNDVEKFCSTLKKQLKEKKLEVTIGISDPIEQLGSYGKSFEYAVAAYKMAVKRKLYCMYYEQMDIYKLFIEINDSTILKKYYTEILGKLEDYDSEHNSNYMEFLKTYLDNNASPQLVSEKEFIHRNTVVNYLKKIDAITGMNMFELDTKVKCTTAFAIRDYLQCANAQED